MIHYYEPVVGKDFFAREDIISDLVKSADAITKEYRQNIAIVGSGLIGKSSLLLHFLNILNNSEKILPVYIDLKGITFREFGLNFIRNIFYHAIKKHTAFEHSPDISCILKNAQRIYPKSCELANRVISLITEGSPDDAFSEIWDIPALLSNESGRCTVLVIDEFTQLSSFPVKRVYQTLGQKIMIQQKTMFVLSSSATVTAKKILSEKLSMLFGGFKVIDIGPFDPAESGKFIEAKSKNIFISKATRDFITAFTGGHPFYLSSIINKINFTGKCGLRQIKAKHISNIVAELLFSAGGAINQFFCKILSDIDMESPGINALDTLRFFAKTGSLSEIMGRNIISSSELNNLMDKFLEFGLIQKSGSLYAITDAVFRMWVDMKSKSRNLCFDFIPKQEWNDYANEVESRIALFKEECLKSFDKKMAELIGSFNDDKFFIDERLRILPRIGKITLKKLHKYDILEADADKKKCLFVICRTSIREEDIVKILSSIKIVRKPKPKVIFIAPFGIELSAKLLAKQKYCWIWGRSDIIKLFTFYKGYNALIA
jgi:AAA+ ATPase superfamily predicted ATPase